MRVFNRKRTLAQLAMRWSDGGAAPAAPAAQPEAPPAAASAAPASQTAAPAATAAPASSPAAQPADPPASQPGSGKTYTDAELEAARAEAVAAYKAHLEEARDYEKMTAEEKVAYLEAKAADDKLTGYAMQRVAAEGLPVELVSFAKGKDESDTDERVKALKAVIDKGVQAGVEARFKQNAFVPRSSAAGAAPSAEAKDRPRGVSVQ